VRALCETALTTVSAPEMFRYWLQARRINIGFLTRAQIDRYGNLNSTVIGDYERPKVRQPGGGGAPEIAGSCNEIFIVMRQSPKALVPTLHFRTSLGHGNDGKESQAFGLRTKGPTLLITDLCLMRPEPETFEFTVRSLHPGVTRDEVRKSSAWPVRFAEQVNETPSPTTVELETLRGLHARMEEGHQSQPASG
jgi:glutaconate CoA-transferase, subunit B